MGRASYTVDFDNLSSPSRTPSPDNPLPAPSKPGRKPSKEAIRGFAGEEIEKAKYYLEDEGFLLELEPEVQHYEIYSAD